ncbi:prenyltransferase/squalene oxidase repeat-containing protein [Sphingomonas sp.]|uniref:prenyltransferase/squalene oxidase repeat-containing protein n=1 Tax=Sphingomonas sp. TaxID=28214 RepID=UPI002EDAF88F
MNPGIEPDADLSPLGSLALLWPAMPESLVSPAARRQLEDAAARLSAIPRVALELRLDEGDDTVDLHQFITQSTTDAAALRRYLARSSTSGGGDLVSRFLEAWADDTGGVRTDLSGFFLEWDGPGGRAATPPAIFLPVQHRHERGPEDHTSRDRVAGHIARLNLAGAHVGTLLRTIPTAISISYVGFMLGRGAGVRLNLRSVRPGDVADVLAGLGWPGDLGRASAMFGRLVELTGQVALALDFSPAIQPSIGFECALPHLPAQEPRWREYFDWLCAEGLCTPEKRAGLERLGARHFPEDRGQAWPAQRIAATLAAPPQFVPWYERRLSHVKVSISANAHASAKAYVSAQHHWNRGSNPAPPHPQADGPGSATDCVTAAIGRAAGFLITERQQDDFWRDFQLVNGASDEWVTAFVGYALVESGVPLPAGLVTQTVRALLRRQRPNGGWAYNRISPADADSTAWVLKFLRAAAYSGPEVQRAEAFLLSHLRADGGLSTYAAATRLRFSGAATGRDDAGWRGGHLCVAANAAGVIGQPLNAFLLSAQDTDGTWPAYWWRSDAFSSALAAQSLAQVAGTGESVARAVAWARGQVASESAAFARAWLIALLLRGGTKDRGQARALAVALAAEQRSDGGWDASAAMLFPDPAEIHRRPGMPVVPDERRLFTAASTLLAFSSLLAAECGA